MTPKKQPPSIQQTAIGDGIVQVAGDKNTVNINQTFIQKVINNIFKGDAETVEQRNRSIMLGHVENFWVKGILDKSLHGAALLELGIKEEPDALNYPWAIKRNSTKETLPAGTSMLEIFEEIGMGRSLLILGAPGSGKTTMLLELTRQLVERAREDVIEPIPVVFNLSSWTKKLTLADWLERELVSFYRIDKDVAKNWVNNNKLLLLLDGLDEVRQENRESCVDVINHFRSSNGLTSLAVCSRIQDYSELKTRLSFDGAVEILPLTSEQVNVYFESLGERLTGIRRMLENDTVLLEMAETPLDLSVMVLAYQHDPIKVFASKGFRTVDEYRKHLFDTYIEHAFDRFNRTKNKGYTFEQTKRWLAFLAWHFIHSYHSVFSAHTFSLEEESTSDIHIRLEILIAVVSGTLPFLAFYFSFPLNKILVIGLGIGLIAFAMFATRNGTLLILSPTGLLALFGLPRQLANKLWTALRDVVRLIALVSYLILVVGFFITWLFWNWLHNGLASGILVGIFIGLIFTFVLSKFLKPKKYDALGCFVRAAAVFYVCSFLLFGVSGILISKYQNQFSLWLMSGTLGGLLVGLGMASMLGIENPFKESEEVFIRSSSIRVFDQTISFIKSLQIFIVSLLFFGLIIGFLSGTVDPVHGLRIGLIFGIVMSIYFSSVFGGLKLISCYCARFMFLRSNKIPWNLDRFLKYCADLIFLRRVGGGYIFVHRLLMEHFATMYSENAK